MYIHIHLGLAGIWKERYLTEKRQLDEKLARVGKKVKGMWETEERRKKLRSIQVLHLCLASGYGLKNRCPKNANNYWRMASLRLRSQLAPL